MKYTWKKRKMVVEAEGAPNGVEWADGEDLFQFKTKVWPKFVAPVFIKNGQVLVCYEFCDFKERNNSYRYIFCLKNCTCLELCSFLL